MKHSAGWVIVLCALVFGCCAEKRVAPCNVLMITMDTTRADRFGCYGKKGARTPNLDALAAEGTLFERCFTAVPITTPSHSTMFTGLYPMGHGVRDNGLFRLPDGAVTLAETLRDSGWATGAAVGSFPVTREFNLDQGFDYFNDHITIEDEDFSGRRDEPNRGLFFDERPAPWVNDAILPWIDKNADQPFFAWIHYWDPHHPHVPPPPFSELFGDDRYQGEIALVDQALGVVLETLEKRGVADRTIVIVVGDHGEGIGEHGEDTHSLVAYNATLNVPFIVKIPGHPAAGSRVARRVGTVDIMPTILEILGVPAPDGLSGHSLLPWIDDPARLAAEGEDVYYAETLSPRLSHGWGEIRALFEGQYKYLHGPRPELFDVVADPGELENLIDSKPEVASRMKEALAKKIVQESRPLAAVAVTDQPDDQMLARLAALGYVSTTVGETAEVQEVLREDGTPPQDRLEDNSLVGAAKEHLRKGEFLAARELAASLVANDSDNPYYRSLLVHAVLGLGRLDEATAMAETETEIGSRNYANLLQVAVALVGSGQRQRGLELASRIVSSYPSSEGWYLLGEMHAVIGDRMRYRQALDEALEMDANNRRARLSLAVLLEGEGASDAAVREFVRLVRDDPADPRARMNYGVFLAQSGSLDDARDQLQMAVDLSPGYWAAQVALMAVHIDRGDAAGVNLVAAEVKERCSDPRWIARVNQLLEMS